MSLIVADRTSLANEDSHMTTSESENIATSASSVDAKANTAAEVARVEDNDKDKDNEKHADCGQTASSRVLDQLPSNGQRTSQSGVEQEHGRQDAGTEAAQNDVSSPSSVRRQSTTSRFKEKRPEPLKLNPNQEIPLDLSVKSAGNVPSGNIFNLAILSTSQGPLETPRIQWQDNDTLLSSAKGRLFSSSTNTSQRARLTSLIGDSPPITPGTPMIENMFSPSGAATIRSSCEMPHSASWAVDSPLHSFLMSSPFELNKLQLLDKSLQSSNKPVVNHHHLRAESRAIPRRSCSTDNLSGARRGSTLCVVSNETAKRGSATGAKKSSVSPLATKNLSNWNGATDSTTKFPYTSQQIALSNKNDAQKSPSSSTCSSNNGGKSLTPTGLTNATANLLNIHLNSPNGHSSQSPTSPGPDMDNKQVQQLDPYKTMGFTSFDSEPSPLDPLLSAVSYCQQRQLHQQHPKQQQKSPVTNMPFASCGSDHSFGGLGQFHQQHPGSGSSATLNTPTLISPSQMKAGHVCFLPSPTLSPMSSVFDIPSPLLMRPPTSANSQQQQQQHQTHQRLLASATTTENANGTTSQTIDPSSRSSSTNPPRLGLQPNGSQEAIGAGAERAANCVAQRSSSDNGLSTSLNDTRHRAGRNDLSQLITTAAEKSGIESGTGYKDDLDADVDMETDGGATNHGKTGEYSSGVIITATTGDRPATVIPQICVSNEQLTERAKQAGESGQRDTLPCERSLSPSSRWARANEHLEGRHESSSAPPGVYQPHVKPKLKTIGADSCFNLSGSTALSANQIVDGKLTCTPNQGQARPARISSKPYPNIRRLILGSSQHLQDPGLHQDGHCFHEARSNSAEPAVFSRANASKVSQQNPQTTGPHQAEGITNGQLYLRPNISSSMQHLPHTAKTESQAPSHFYQQRQLNDMSRVQQPQYQARDLDYAQGQYYAPQPSGQRQDFGYHNQQNSLSATDLNGMPRDIRQGYPPVVSSQLIAAAAASNDAISAHNRPHGTQHQHFFLPNPQANIPSTPMNRFGHLHSYNNGGIYQQHFAQQFRHTPTGPSATTSSVPLLRLAGRHNSKAPHIPVSDNGLLRSTRSNPMAIGEQVHQGQSSGLVNGVDPLCRQANLLHGGCPLECESRSESRSSCSLDFIGPFGVASGGGSGRSDNPGGANLVAKKYHCDHCSKSFTRSDMLTRHRRLHSGDRPFQCNECKQEFSRSDHLSTHMRTHTGEKPYKCKLCSYSACRKDMITRHLKVHNRNPHSMDQM